MPWRRKGLLRLHNRMSMIEAGKGIFLIGTGFGKYSILNDCVGWEF